MQNRPFPYALFKAKKKKKTKKKPAPILGLCGAKNESF